MSTKAYGLVLIKMLEIKSFSGSITSFVENELHIKNKNIKPFIDVFELLKQEEFLAEPMDTEWLWQDKDELFKFSGEAEKLLTPEKIFAIMENRRKSGIKGLKDKKPTEEIVDEQFKNIMSSGILNCSNKSYEERKQILNDLRKNPKAKETFNEMIKFLGGNIPSNDVTEKMTKKNIKKVFKKFLNKQKSNDNTDEAMNYMPK